MWSKNKKVMCHCFKYGSSTYIFLKLLDFQFQLSHLEFFILNFSFYGLHLFQEIPFVDSLYVLGFVGADI